MTTLCCAACGATVCHVEDTRFGMAPAACLCLRCSHPAFAGARKPRPGEATGA